MKSFQLKHAFILLFLTAFPLYAKPGSLFADTEMYRSVLDRLFDIPADSKISVIEVMQYLPVNSGESQLVIQEVNGEMYQIDTWSLPPGTKSIWQQLGALYDADNHISVEQAVAKIKVDHRKGLVAKRSALGRAILRGDSIKVELGSRNFIALDADRYMVSFRSSSRSLSLSVSGSSHKNEDKDPVIEWMNSVRALADLAIKPGK